MKNLLILLLLLFAFFPFIAKGYAVINVYYNGTVIAHIYNESEFTLVGNYAGGLHVIGSKYNFTDNQLYLENGSNVTIYYQTTLKGVVKAQESYNFTLNVILPSNVSISYLSTQPYSFTVVNNFYNISFRDVNNVLILYAESSMAMKNQTSNTEFYLILALVIIDIILIGLLLRFLLSRRKTNEQRAEEDVTPTVVNEVLDERDKMVLEAIKNGAKTLSEIINKTGLPKATAYRRVKKLVGLGYVEEVRERGKVYYKFKEEGKM